MPGASVAEAASLDSNNQDMHGFDGGTVHILLLQKNGLHAIIYRKFRQGR